MHAFARRLHGASGQASGKITKGLIIDRGWRYDLTVWFSDTFLFRGALRRMWLRAADLARMQPGEQALDVGCGTGTLALTIQRRVGGTGRVVGIDPGKAQIARARVKAARRRMPIEFHVGVIERLPFPDQSFDVALSTLMMHHLPAPLKRQGLAELARVLKPGGRLVIADFTSRKGRQGKAARFHAGGSDLHALAALVADAGFSQVEIEEAPNTPGSAFPGAGFITARKG